MSDLQAGIRRMAALDPPTNRDENSRAAAESIRSWAKGDRRRVLLAIADGFGVTTAELEERLSGRHQTVSARVYELHRLGLIVRDGKRPTPSGRNAWIYRLNPAYVAGLSRLRAEWA